MLAPWKKTYDNPRQGIKKRIVKAMVFPVIMYRCDSWTIKKADCQRIDAFTFFSTIGQKEMFGKVFQIEKVQKIARVIWAYSGPSTEISRNVC